MDLVDMVLVDMDMVMVEMMIRDMEKDTPAMDIVVKEKAVMDKHQPKNERNHFSSPK